MKCANPSCQNQMDYLRGGSLRLLELESTPTNRLHGEAGGFPVCRSVARYFWLCPECSRILVMRRWSRDGVILEARDQRDDAQPAAWSVPAQPAVDADTFLHLRRAIAKPA